MHTTKEFTKIRWHNNKSNKWITDYCALTDNTYCLIAVEDNNPRYTYCIAKHFGDKIYDMLEDSMKKILKENVKIKCLSMESNRSYITGNFEVSPITEEDGYCNWSSEGNISD